ncbi:DUF6843 domain-containing protein [Risungbinella massiliensis]|uniref:DUF6843 domain-containing protein n=1 Tax=Risungbinella massiliensis TaxID=1329796 RepID=UPI0005CC2396|nr:hypothetical protein [Risungbinella massiliensis]
MKKFWLSLGAVILLAFLLMPLAPLIIIKITDARPPSVYLIPNGYKGWFYIVYDVPNTPELPKLDDKLEFEIPSNGILKTSTKHTEYGWAKDEYYYVENGKRIKIPEEKMIHGGGTSGTDYKGKSYEYQMFFVSNQKELELQSVDLMNSELRESLFENN